eukprot:TRINITY_DN169_c0_g3_i1.p1 TRINITY_DN169_c0_g3~~TRINITY_DN169_c0_g3_i1.p1  ORF type:complete len:239 (+),score=34.83 TRINITY_DN169_c0_g3_i1:69-785(+)
MTDFSSQIAFFLFGIIVGLIIRSLFSGRKSQDASGHPTWSLVPPHPSTSSAVEGGFEQTTLNQVRRLKARASYDKETVWGILDSQMLCHVSFIDIVDGKSVPVSIPMLYGRQDDSVYVHGHVSSGLQQKLIEGKDVCLSVAVVDDLVYAHSLFHSSVNYRSVVCFGTARVVEEREEQLLALERITENTLPGRWDHARLPNSSEITTTGIIRITIHSASVKQRKGRGGRVGGGRGRGRG